MLSLILVALCILFERFTAGKKVRFKTVFPLSFLRVYFQLPLKRPRKEGYTFDFERSTNFFVLCPIQRKKRQKSLKPNHYKMWWEGKPFFSTFSLSKAKLFLKEIGNQLTFESIQGDSGALRFTKMCQFVPIIFKKWHYDNHRFHPHTQHERVRMEPSYKHAAKRLWKSVQFLLNRFRI